VIERCGHFPWLEQADEFNVVFDEDEGVAAALRRDAELDTDPTQAMTLRDLDSYIQKRRKS
jgi:hypothetical protein